MSAIWDRSELPEPSEGDNHGPIVEVDQGKFSLFLALFLVLIVPISIVVALIVMGLTKIAKFVGL
jgi:hypothetical protein